LVSPVLRWALALLLAAGAFAGVAAAGCGPSAPAVAWKGFVPPLEPFVRREDEVWRRSLELHGELESDPRGPRFYPYVETTSLPFYAEFDAKAVSLAPAEPGLQPAYEALRKFIDARRAYLVLVLGERDLMQHAEQIIAVDQANADANVAMFEYGRLAGDETPDYRRADLLAIASKFRSQYLEPAFRGDLDIPAVQQYLRGTVIPQMRKLRESRFEDDDASKGLRRAITLQLEAMEALDRVAEPYIRMGRAQSVREAARRKADSLRDAFQAALREAERKR
jgi:hypothetical protein